MVTCRCPICGAKRAGRPGAKSFGTRLVWRDEHGNSEVGRDRPKERRLRRRREEQEWKSAVWLNFPDPSPKRFW